MDRLIECAHFGVRRSGRLTALEAGLVVFVSAGDALLSGVHGLLALRALRVFDGLERHGCCGVCCLCVGLFGFLSFFFLGVWGNAE